MFLNADQVQHFLPLLAPFRDAFTPLMWPSMRKIMQILGKIDLDCPPPFMCLSTLFIFNQTSAIQLFRAWISKLFRYACFASFCYTFRVNKMSKIELLFCKIEYVYRQQPLPMLCTEGNCSTEGRRNVHIWNMHT